MDSNWIQFESMDVITAYQSLRAAIFSGRLKPGERLVSQQIADELGASRSPVREALARLESDGLVVRIGQWGYSVRVMTLHEAEHLFEARLVIEVANARLGAQRLKPEILQEMAAAQKDARAQLKRGRLVEFQRASRRVHERIAAMSGNTQLARMFQQINDLVLLFGLTLLRASPARADEILEENEAIIQAMASGSPERAGQAMQRHIARAHEHFRASLTAAAFDVPLI